MADPTRGAARSDAPDPLIGRLIHGRFTIREMIARGGMGKVYRAEQAPLGRACAVKVLNPNYAGDADPEFHKRFFLEASTASKLTHPNTVTIFDYGCTDDDVYFMAMELLEGQTLHQAIRGEAPFDEARALHIARQLCRALREAHTHGVIHRDLKPANVFLVQHGDETDFVKVLDFGLVKDLDRPDDPITQTGLFMGSPKYMAPEQIQGAAVDARTDIYALGIILYEMLTGKVPFDRPTSVNILMAHVGEAPLPMRVVNPNLACSPAVDAVVMRCIAKAPAERYSSMDDVLLALKQASGQPHLLTGTYSLPQIDAASPYVAELAANQVVATGSQAQMPLLHAESLAYEMDAPRRRARVVFAALGAIAFGALAGLIAFKLTARTGPTPVVVLPGKAPESPAAPPSPPRPARADAVERVHHVAVVTTPPGAVVQAGDSVLCAETPCTVTFRGAAAEPGTTHEVTVAHRGFRSETVSLGPAQSTLNVALQKVSPRGTKPPAAAGSSPEPVPTGFKDTPY